MKVTVELPAPVAGALLRYAEDKGFSSIAGGYSEITGLRHADNEQMTDSASKPVISE